jgi:hypothetical protein
VDHGPGYASSPPITLKAPYPEIKLQNIEGIKRQILVDSPGFGKGPHIMAVANPESSIEAGHAGLLEREELGGSAAAAGGGERRGIDWTADELHLGLFRDNPRLAYVVDEVA